MRKRHSVTYDRWKPLMPTQFSLGLIFSIYFFSCCVFFHKPLSCNEKEKRRQKEEPYKHSKQKLCKADFLISQRRKWRLVELTVTD